MNTMLSRDDIQKFRFLWYDTKEQFDVDKDAGDINNASIVFVNGIAEEYDEQGNPVADEDGNIVYEENQYPFIYTHGVKFAGGDETGGSIDKRIQNAVSAETTRAQTAEQSLHDLTDAETIRAIIKENDLQAQIDAIVSKDATVNLAATPTTIFVGTATDIALTATTNTDATAITIKRGTDTLAAGSGKTLSHTDPSVTLYAPGTLAYSADFTISGLHRSTNKNVIAVYPIFYGAQAEFDAASLAQYATPTTTVARAYTVQLDSTRRKFYLRVPKQGVAQVKSVVMGSGSEASPVSGNIIAALSDENYNVWASDDGFTGNGPQVFTVS